MNKINILFGASICLVLASIPIFFSDSLTIINLILLVTTFLTISAILAFVFAQSNKEYSIPSKFTLIQGLASIAYTIVIVCFASDLNQFLMITSYFLLSYGLVEIAFPFSVLNSSAKLIFKPMIFRIIAGIVSVFGAVILLLASFEDHSIAMIISGCLIAFTGLSNILFVYRIQKIDPTEFRGKN